MIRRRLVVEACVGGGYLARYDDGGHREFADRSDIAPWVNRQDRRVAAERGDEVVTTIDWRRCPE